MTKQLLASYVVFICIAICLLGVVLWQHEMREAAEGKKAYSVLTLYRRVLGMARNPLLAFR